MTDAVAIAGITGAVTVVSSLIAAIVSIRNGKKADKLAVKADQIHAVTNSAKKLVDEDLKRANKEIARLSRELSGGKAKPRKP